MSRYSASTATFTNYSILAFLMTNLTSPVNVWWPLTDEDEVDHEHMDNEEMEETDEDESDEEMGQNEMLNYLMRNYR